MWKLCCIFVFCVYFIFQPASLQSETSNKIFCEFSTSVIACSTSIRVISATYGRTEAEITECPRGNVRTFNCSTDVLLQITELCDSKQRCRVEAASRLYGDPCPNVFKYLNITYICTVQLPRMTTEKVIITSEENLTTPDDLLTTSEEPANTSEESRTTSREEPTETESDKFVIIGIIAGVAAVFALTALFINIALFHKRRSRPASNKTEEYNMSEDNLSQKETATTSGYLEISGSHYSHKYQDLTTANGVKSKIDESDGYLDERGIYDRDKCPDMTSGNQTAQENVYDYID